MKLQCDVCAAEAATVFCCADEATLCDACDRRVHCANKLAGKHRRFSLLHGEPSTSPSAQKHPLCEMCQVSDTHRRIRCTIERADDLCVCFLFTELRQL
jgi:hypothetical protein